MHPALYCTTPSQLDLEPSYYKAERLDTIHLTAIFATNINQTSTYRWTPKSSHQNSTTLPFRSQTATPRPPPAKPYRSSNHHVLVFCAHQTSTTQQEHFRVLEIPYLIPSHPPPKKKKTTQPLTYPRTMHDTLHMHHAPRYTPPLPQNPPQYKYTVYTPRLAKTIPAPCPRKKGRTVRTTPS